MVVPGVEIVALEEEEMALRLVSLLLVQGPLSVGTVDAQGINLPRAVLPIRTIVFVLLVRLAMVLAVERLDEVVVLLLMPAVAMVQHVVTFPVMNADCEDILAIDASVCLLTWLDVLLDGLLQLVMSPVAEALNMGMLPLMKTMALSLSCAIWIKSLHSQVKTEPSRMAWLFRPPRTYCLRTTFGWVTLLHRRTVQLTCLA